MALCVNKNSAEFKELGRMTKMSDTALSIEIMTFMDMYGRFPNIDELSNPDSANAMIEDMSLIDKKTRMVGKADNLLSGKTEEQFRHEINNKYRDYDTDTLVIDDSVILYPIKRPFILGNIDEKIKVDSSNNKGKNISVLNAIAERMNRIHGMNVITFTNEMASEMPELNGTSYNTRNAMILNGNIYINLDNASIDAPVHELMHLMLGELKFNNNKLYNSIVESVYDMPQYNILRNSEYRNFAEHDAMEEIFVSEAAKYITGMDSIINKIDKKNRSIIDYAIKRMIDSTIFGANTSMDYDVRNLANMSIIDLCYEFGSALVNSKNEMSDLGYKARVSMNLKRKLIENNELTEKCI